MPTPPPPMLATPGGLPTGPGWAYEFKWDGVRALAVFTGPQSHWYARSGAEITLAYPELSGLGATLAERGVTDAVLDGEIVVLDDTGRPSFSALAERMHVREAGRARQLAQSAPATYMIFDILAANGTDIRGVPYAQRRELLDSLALPGQADPHAGDLAGSSASRWLVPPTFTDGPATMAAAKELSLEGVVAKRLTSSYRPGVRSPDWIKLKHDLSGDFAVGGWRVGRRALGALLVGRLTPDGLHYRGRVGGGISAAAERELLSLLTPLRVATSPFVDVVPRVDAHGATFVSPQVVVEVRYGNLTPDGRLRFPRFVRLRPDKSPVDSNDA